MDRLTASACAYDPVGRFPRPRGDGPSTIGWGSSPSWVSPPTRGWTDSVIVTVIHGGGFPAHAGMDPLLAPRCSDRRCLRFPRPRGDGPCFETDATTVSMVSPPTRGWTPVHRLRDGIQQGFPAHAGMDPASCSQRAVGARFPRPRGDGPTTAPGINDLVRVSPPTRGWTSDDVAAPHRDAGFPAHAGMDLADQLGAVSADRFPRPRGDGPG